MGVELIFAPEVEQDLSEAYSWYQERRVGLGEEFLTVWTLASKPSAATRKCTPSSIRTTGEAWLDASPTRYSMSILATQ
jgi:hypothetical protein